MKNRPFIRLAFGATAALLGLVIASVVTASAVSAAPLGGRGPYTCTRGNIPPGTYKSMLITGLCYMKAGTIVIRGNLTVGPRALLDAGASPGDPRSKPVVTATVRVGGNVFVGKGAVLVLGCSPNLLNICPHGLTFDSIGGSLTAVNALADVVHGTFISGNVTIMGGGGGAAGGAASAGCFKTKAHPIPAPWSEDAALAKQVPQFTDFEDGSIGGDLSVTGVRTCWMGAFNLQVRGSLTWADDVASDPDGNEVANNLMGGNIACRDNDPKVQFGDSGDAPNLVRRHAIGECGFNVVLPSPAPEAGQGPGIREPITVRTGSLKTYHGTHKATRSATLPPVRTESGYTITADINNIVLAGTGLTGSGPPSSAQPGEGVLSTVYPNGSKSFIAYDTCKCSLGGHAGAVLIRFYGTTSPNGLTHGTFLIDSGGAAPLISGVTRNALATLAGWGTFSSVGQPAGTWCLVEHLRITKPLRRAVQLPGVSGGPRGLSGHPLRSGRLGSLGDLGL
jgi:hypothetical protein